MPDFISKWCYNPHDRDVKIRRTKDGACDMVHKLEHVVDLDSEAIVSAEVRPGDADDTADLSTRVQEAVERVEDLYDGELPDAGGAGAQPYRREGFP